MSTEKHLVAVEMPSGLVARLDQLAFERTAADKRRVSRSEIIRIAVEQYLDRVGRSESGEAA